MTQPDGFIPDGAPSDTGLAALAAKTQEDWEDELFGGVNDKINPLAGLFAIVTDVFIGVAETVIGFFSSLVDLPGMLEVLDDILQFFYGLLNRSGFLDLFGKVMEFFTWVWELFTDVFDGDLIETILKPIFEFLKWLGDLFDGAIETLLMPIFDFLKWLFDLFEDGIESLLKPIFEFLKGANLQSLTGVIDTLWGILNGGATAVGKTLADVVSSVGDFVSGLIPQLTGVPGSLSLSDVGSWASNLLTRGLSWLDLKTIFGEIPSSILGVLPIANINLVNPELMSQGGFDTETTLPAGEGWEWDDTNTHSGSGGSAKVTGNGTDRALYSNQSIAVAAGDELLISCWVKSTGTVGSMGIRLSVVEFTGTTETSTTLVAHRASSASWVSIGGGTYTVPSGITSIRVKVHISSAAESGSFVWFDDVSVKKTGLLSGNWMGGLLGTVVEDFQQIADSIAQAIRGVVTAGTGNGLTTVLTNIQTIFTRLFDMASLPASLILNPLLEAAIPGLSGSKITSGEINIGRIPTDDIGAELNPGVGSGATLTRTGTTSYSASTGRNPVGTGFYNSLSSSADITALTSGGDYTGQFEVSMDGWYLCEIGFRIDPSAGYDWNVAPLLYKNGSAFRIGSDAMLVNALVANAQRYTQSSFIVYLEDGQNVGAGYDASGAFTDLFSGSGTSIDTYFSVSLLNKSYA